MEAHLPLLGHGPSAPCCGNAFSLGTTSKVVDMTLLNDVQIGYQIG